ncbi:hypothetical protein, partial [Nocardia abscessus]|uniref:hypothetical protein n=1 Tax=Nocardia abscessus TaxID=120957 RepID=UPI003CC7EE68
MSSTPAWYASAAAAAGAAGPPRGGGGGPGGGGRGRGRGGGPPARGGLKFAAPPGGAAPRGGGAPPPALRRDRERDPAACAQIAAVGSGALREGAERPSPPVHLGYGGRLVGLGRQRPDEHAEAGFRGRGRGVACPVPARGELVGDGPPGDVVDHEAAGHDDERGAALGTAGEHEVDVAPLFGVERGRGCLHHVVDGQRGLATLGVQPAERLARALVGGRDAQHGRTVVVVTHLYPQHRVLVEHGGHRAAHRLDRTGLRDVEGDGPHLDALLQHPRRVRRERQFARLVAVAA